MSNSDDHIQRRALAAVSKHLAPLALLLVFFAVCDLHLANADDLKLPLLTTNVTVKRDSIQQFAAGMEKFAKANSLSFDVSQTSPDPAHLLFQMKRTDVEIAAVTRADSRTPSKVEYGIGFYAGEDSSPVPQTMKALFTALQSALRAVGGVEFLPEH